MGREGTIQKVTVFKGEEILQLPWALNLKTKDVISTDTRKGDGKIEYTKTKKESVEIELEVSSSLPLSTRCKITGEEYINGMKINSINSLPTPLAIACEILDDQTNLPKLRKLYTNVTLNIEESENSGDESAGETLKFKGVGIADENGDFDYVISIEEAEKNVEIKAIWDKFFTEKASRPTA